MSLSLLELMMQIIALCTILQGLWHDFHPLFYGCSITNISVYELITLVNYHRNQMF